MKVIRQVLLIILLFIATNIFYTNSTYVPVISMLEKMEVKNLEENEIAVYFLPIHQGEATLIQLADESFYLIDTGATEYVEDLVQLLHSHGVEKLKGIFLTNTCKDHIGGLNVITNNFQVENVYVPQLTATTFHLPEQVKDKVITLKIKDRIMLGNELVLLVLSPEEPLSLSPQANSLVFQLFHKDIKFLFTSDIDQNVEKRLVSKFGLRSEILKVSDFGSNEASSGEFLEEVDAQVAVIFSSDPELYKISEEALERLNESWIDVFILKRHGEIEIVSNGDNYILEIRKNRVNE